MENYKISDNLEELKGSYIFQGDSLDVMKKIPSKSVHLAFTSPPYAGSFRNYNKNGIPHPKDIGRKNPEDFINEFIPYVLEIQRILKHEDGGTFILNIGEKYLDGFASKYPYKLMLEICDKTELDLIDEIPWVKCLSGETKVFIKNDNLEYDIKLSDLYELFLDHNESVFLWDGSKWNKLLLIKKSIETSGLRIKFKNGFSVSCTKEHKWLKEDLNEILAKDLEVDDILLSTGSDVFEILNIEKVESDVFYTVTLEEEPHRFMLSSGLFTRNCDPFPNKNSRVGTLGWEHIFVFGSEKKKIIKNVEFMKSPYRTSKLSISNRRNYKRMRNHTNHPMNDVRCFEDIGALPRNYLISNQDRLSLEEYEYLEEHYCLSATQTFKGSAHMAQMPIHLAEYFVGGFSHEGHTVLDPFGGGGTTAAAARSLGREFVIIDLFEDNCNYIQKRVDAIPQKRSLFNFYGLSKDSEPVYSSLKEKNKMESQDLF